MTTAGEAAVGVALSMVGRPYAYGAATGDLASFDCSSLVQWAWGLAGVALPRASIDQLQALPPSPIHDLRPGDLVFYDNDGPRYRGVNHVVMWMGDGLVVEASSLAGGVHVIALAAKGRPLGVRRPGLAGEVPAWRYEVPRAVGMAGPWVLQRGAVRPRAAAMAATPSGGGHWVAAVDGRVMAYGDAVVAGHGIATVTAMASTPAGLGYWLARADGTIMAFGDAPHLGDGDRPVMGMAAVPSSPGYWLVDALGRVSAHGAACHYGDAAIVEAPVVALAATPSGLGYWVADGAGRVSAFGDAEPRGGCTSDEPVVAMAASGDGYRMVDAAGRVFAFERAVAAS